ncbi:MAG TPA: peptide-N-glycosidase F-related protein, partial [Chitinophagales bacterium]|nr:peptide-N-glycosidase F-related protein [Chitinophagales bacterium]
MRRITATLLIVLTAFSLLANTGDTIRVNGHNNISMTWYGNYDNTTVFPPATKTYHKILMHYIMGCASGGCSGWDYTTIIQLLQHTGLFDSTLAYAPNFTVNGVRQDSLVYSANPTYTTGYDSVNNTTDSVLNTQLLVRNYADTTHPYTQTDSVLVYPAGYWNYYYDNGGNIIDSAYVGGTTRYVYLTHVYTPREIMQPHELGRVITPYGSYYTSIPNWSNDYVFDVTDYAPLLHDTVILRDFYSGWSSGFSVTLKFEMIEGTPPRTVKNIYPMFNGYFAYGSTSDPIANHMLPMTFALSDSEQHVMFRITPTGHGEGSADDCDEFCDKYYDLFINDQMLDETHVWRSDCDVNSLIHQSGNWITSRANWCPGAKGLSQDHEIPSSYFTPGDSIKVEVQMEPYTEPGGGAGLQMAGELFTYGAPNQQVDATIDDVIQPSNIDAFSRFNPVCANPIIILRNLGAQPLSSVTIRYGMVGETNYDYHWNRTTLTYNQVDTVMLPNIVLNDSTPSHIFQAYTYYPNGLIDNYPYNDTVRVYTDFPPSYDSVFVFAMKTNMDATQDSWTLTDDAGN